MKLNHSVGDEVCLKVRIRGIELRGDNDYYINFDYPDWFNQRMTKSGCVTASQNLIVGLVDEQVKEKEDNCKSNAEKLAEINKALDELLAGD